MPPFYLSVHQFIDIQVGITNAAANTLADEPCLVPCMGCDHTPCPTTTHESHSSPAPRPHVLLADPPQSILASGGSRCGQERAYRWGGVRRSAGLQPPTTSQSRSSNCNPLYDGAGAGHRDRRHPSTPLARVSSQAPPLPSKSGQTWRQLALQSAFLPTPAQPPGP